MYGFWCLQWFNRLQTGRLLTVRDLLSWIDFINVTEGSLSPEVSMLHGAFLILLDGLSLGIIFFNDFFYTSSNLCFNDSVVLFSLNELYISHVGVVEEMLFIINFGLLSYVHGVFAFLVIRYRNIEKGGRRVEGKVLVISYGAVKGTL